MSKHANTELSNLINYAMDCIGYSLRNIRSRAAYYENMIERVNILTSQRNLENDGDLRYEIILTGSKSEGVVQLLESDTDMMFVFRNFLCVDSGRNENDLTVIRTHMTESPPGYTKLIPLNMDAERYGSSVLAFSTVYDLTEGHILLLSSCARNFHEELFKVIGRKLRGVRIDIVQHSGPSVPMSMKQEFGGILSLLNIQPTTDEFDLVLAMPYLSSSILEAWKDRRRHDWPRHDVIQDVSTMEGFVVPVGPKFSEEQNFEWRICYTTAEKKLARNFNSVQSKLYVLLKMIFKQIVNPECDLISSYMLKNIVFWLCEKYASYYFTDDKLIDLLLYSFAFLLNCLYANFLPNYMIPNRNLLLGKGNPHDKIRLRQMLRDLFKEGGAIVFRLRKLGTIASDIMSNPVLGESYKELRDKIEHQYISIGNESFKNLSPAMLFSRDLFYNLVFETWRSPASIELLISLMALLKMDMFQIFTDSSRVQELLRRITEFLS